jgi:uncharacterized membrane protein
MADYPAPVAQTRQPPVNATLIVYALFAIAAIAGIVGHGLLVGAPLFTLIGIVAVIIAYVARSDARGTWLESHVGWQIRTFWWSLLWTCVGWIFAVTLIGIPVAWVVWVATTIWVLYRVVKGYLRFHQSQPVSGL